MDLAYKQRYIAFLDILGFKELVYRSEMDQEVLQRIDKAINYMHSNYMDNYEGDMPMVDLGKQVSFFSDSIVISYDVYNPGAGFFVLIDLVHICMDLISIGILVRGGVTVGSLIHENNKCYGPAMVRAYELESKLAIYPRIVIDKSVIEYDLRYRGRANNLEEEMEFINNIIEVDKDGIIYLDYLSQQSEANDYETYMYFICSVKIFIQNSLQMFTNNPRCERILAKYVWLKEYYNEVIVKKFGNDSELLIQ